MRIAVYTGTRNLYPYMVAAAKSLLIHSNVEKIYFLIEDDEFPVELPPKTSIINVSNQTYFKKDGPNYKSEFTYMALIRVALTKILTEDIVLSLDVDTIVNENISSLWNIDISDYYLAAAKQPTKCTDTYMDINAGVMLLNLKKMREDGIDNKLIDYINTTYEVFPEQNAIGKLCQGYILPIPADYNFNDSTDYQHAHSRKISHFAGVHEWQKYPIFMYYYNMKIEEYNKQDIRGLDIIIPSYNDEQGLIRTLTSLYYDFDWLKITVVDDASKVNYTEILKQFPKINLIKSPVNGGPGHARQLGMRNTSQPYLMFVDCGDIILSKYCLLAIKDEIDNNRIPDIYEWNWIDGADLQAHHPYEPSTPGKVYKREFLEVYEIYPYGEGAGSFAAEDCGVNWSCFAIIDDFECVEETPHIQHFDLPIYQTVVNKNSLTYKNEKEFLYTSIPGIVDNGIYCIHNCQRAQVHTDIILDKLNLFLVDLYVHFLRCATKRPELLEKYWKQLRKFYFEVYTKYENEPQNDAYRTTHFKLYLKSITRFTTKPNIKRFVRDLQNNERVPANYYELYI